MFTRADRKILKNEFETEILETKANETLILLLKVQRIQNISVENCWQILGMKQKKIISNGQ